MAFSAEDAIDQKWIHGTRLDKQTHHWIFGSVSLQRTYKGLAFMDDVYKRALKSFFSEIILGCHFTDCCFSEASVTPQSQCHCLEAQVWPLQVLSHFIKEILFCCSFSRCEDLARVMVAPHDTVRISRGSSDPWGNPEQGPELLPVGKLLRASQRMINLLARREKSLDPWCRDGIRRNYDLTSE